MIKNYLTYIYINLPIKKNMKMIYTYEKFNLKFNNPFKKKPVPVVSYNDLDPYGEDNWGDDPLPPVLELAKRQGKPYDQVTFLNCYNNQLTSLEGVENLVNLQWLNCFNNRLTSLEGIENLVSLKGLYCSSNQLTSIEGIENLVNLQVLYCHNNRFSNEYKNYLKNYCEKRKIDLYI